MFSEDSFKLEMCRSDNLWTGKFVYEMHFKEENWFPFINELRKRTLQANGATGTGAKKHKLIMNRFRLEINWSFLTIKWVRSNFKVKLEVFVKELDYVIIPLNSRLALLAEKPSSHSRSGYLSFGIVPAAFHPLVTGGWFKRCLLAAVNATECSKQQGTCPALEEVLGNAAVKLLAMMSRAGN